MIGAYEQFWHMSGVLLKLSVKVLLQLWQACQPVHDWEDQNRQASNESSGHCWIKSIK